MPARKQPGDAIPPVQETSEHMAFLLYVKGELTLSEIAVIVGENENTIRTWKYRRKWDRGIEEVKQLLAKRKPTVEEPHILAAVETREEIGKEYEGNMQQAAKTFGTHVKNLVAEDIIEAAPKLDAADKMFGRRLKLDVDEQAGSGGHISLTFLGAAAEGSVRIISPPVRELTP